MRPFLIPLEVEEESYEDDNGAAKKNQVRLVVKNLFSAYYEKLY